MTGRVYNTARWKRLRALKLSIQPLCEPCSRRGRLVQARHVDHVVSIASGGDPFPPLSDLMSMCASCHSIKTNAKDRAGGKGVSAKGCDSDGLPFDPAHPFLNREAHRATLVCGPPGAGKTTYVHRHRKSGDLVVDFDALAIAISGETSLKRASPAELIPFICEARDALIARLRRRHDLRHAWVIVAAPKRADRHPLAESIDARVVMLDVDPDECERRILGDQRRDGCRDRHVEAVRAWWNEYEPERTHTPLEGRESVARQPAGTKGTQLVPVLARDWGF
ncbi:MAG: AAA family ATPase [Caulobacteraceae bacterium]|nr:AAA family ATPase [Caulobacteraceae bacterium]